MKLRRSQNLENVDEMHAEKRARHDARYVRTHAFERDTDKQGQTGYPTHVLCFARLLRDGLSCECHRNEKKGKIDYGGMYYSDIPHK